MERPRKKIFGPLFFSTLVLSALATACSILISFKPSLDHWFETRALIELTHSTLPRERQSAATTLLRIAPSRAEAHFLESIREADPEIRALGYQSLAELRLDPSRLIPLMGEAARDPASFVRIEAADGLARVARDQARSSKNASTSPILPPELHSAGLGLLNTLSADPEPEVRLAAIWALVSFGSDPEAGRILADRSGDPEGAIRLAAARALMEMNGDDDPAAAGIVASLVVDTSPSEQRPEALELLKDMGPEIRDRAIARLAGLLSAPDPATRYNAMESLSAAGPWAIAALPGLRNIGPEDDPEFRALARLAMARIEGVETLQGAEILIEMVTDPTLMEPHRQAALDLLRQSNLASLSRVTPRLILQLGDPDLAIRVYANDLLSQVIHTMPAEMPTSGRAP